MRIWAVRVVVALALIALAAAAAFAFPEWAPVLAGFLLGVLGTGAGSLLEATIQDDRRRRGLLRALVAEIDENIERVGPADRATAPVRVTRSAWDAARQLELGDDVFDALRKAYAVGEDLNSRIGIMDRFQSNAIATGESTDARREQRDNTLGMSKALGDDCHRVAALAFAAFEKARAAVTPRAQ